MGAVIDEKGLVGVAVTEVPPQQGKNAVLRLDLRAQYAAVIRKAHEAPQLFQFAAHVP